MAGFARVSGRSLTKAWGRQRALAGVDVELRAGEAVALLGPNGAGKSTLLGILATLVQPSAGSVRYDGEAADDDTRRHIGVIAHESLCYGDLSARENLELFARLYGVSEPRRRAAALLERVALGDAAERPARTYSRGMMQRLAVARALLHRPALLLCDEPFTGLDRAGVALLGGLLDEERARGAIVLVVSHELEAICGLIDRVLVLARGRLGCDEPAPAARSSDALAALYQRVTATPIREARS